MKIVVVTGALGFIGRYVSKYYQTIENAYVIGVGNGSCAQSEWSKWGISEWHPGAITVSNLLLYARKPDIIVHCAGGGSVGFSVQHPGVDFTRTVDATSQVLEFIRLHAREAALVYPSSAAVYGCATQLAIGESEALRPVSPYGVHKQLAEELCRMYARNFGLKIAIVRLFSAYGPELRKQLLWDGCRKLLEGTREFPGTGDELRDYIYASDAAKLLALSATKASEECPVVNGGTGYGINVKTVLNSLSLELGLTAPLIFTGQRRIGDPTNLVANAELARSWGWAPSVSWERGVKNYVSWYSQSK